jgi:hypothetical protein
VAGKQQLALMRKKVMSSADQGLSNLGITYVVPFRCIQEKHIHYYLLGYPDINLPRTVLK